MRLSSYQDLAAHIQPGGSGGARCAVAGAADAHVLKAVFEAQRRGWLATPLLIGSPIEIRAEIDGLGRVQGAYEIVDCASERNPSAVAVELVREGTADFILKGRLQTRDLLKPILDKQHGLNDAGFITHFGLMQLAGYHKLLAMSDAAVVPYPSLQDKRKIVIACATALRRLGIERPVIAALCSVETVNPKLPETVDAAALAEMNASGEFGDAIVVGPISYDLATSREAADIKGYASPYAGDVDMLLVPQMVTGNVMSKIWNADPRNILGGCLVGARVPIALTSRAASATEKLHSLLLCSLLSKLEAVTAAGSPSNGL